MGSSSGTPAKDAREESRAGRLRTEAGGVREGACPRIRHGRLRVFSDRTSAGTPGQEWDSRGGRTPFGCGRDAFMSDTLSTAERPASAFHDSSTEPTGPHPQASPTRHVL